MADVEVGRDTFTDTAGVDLGDHTPDVGASWTPVIDAYEIDINGTGLRSLGTALARFNAVAAMANNQAMRITGGATLTGHTVQFAFAIRLVGTASDFSDISGYWAQCDLSGNVTLYKVTTGSFAVIGAAVADPNDPVGTVYEIRANGTTISTKSGATTLHSVTDATYSSGSPYIYTAVTAGFAYDDFFAYNIVADGGRIFKLAGEGGGLVGPSRGLVAAPVYAPVGYARRDRLFVPARLAA